MTYQPTPIAELSDTVSRIKNLAAFSKRSGIPRTTLWRLSKDAGYPLRATARIAIENALKRLKPELREAAL